ncbi:uncharacterized protein MYCFIDRAFT_76744 [Pseudocercospora fijiensis CIRAD86]|uniref:Guanine nucleotide-binding protein-like 3 N-terminal domain-containing protein n=1 Tax=Pseudocercospora fijiensis (strain CIRAD86) TaxID=383855 RepID=N1QCJ5_PSEFD|nr:uncharacterized protein MYCFIDRAFT_76744 [Pseudocercospora fijiensis CIRAD86]EME89407.1 hypothetical protein MYCFIDRAFT_76744 [Pseudocercospora fijiensis CIRAD86]
MKVGKPQSKRVPVRLRHKIQKASANKQRKARKDAKKNPQWRSRLKKDPGIPNLFPYKDKVLAEIEESKRLKEEEKLRKRELARAQREGQAVADEVEIEEQMDDADEVEDEVDENMDEGEGGASSNPMAALVASAQARAKTYAPADDEDDDEDEDEEEEFSGFQDKRKPTSTKSKAGVRPSAPKAKPLPKSVLADPIKPVMRLITKLSGTQTGVQQILDYYKLPPLVTAGSDTTTRFLIDVARKKGRLGPGGVPSLNGAALAVLGDLNEGRLKLGLSTEPERKVGDVVVVEKLGEAFKIEGLFGDEEPSNAGGEMEVEA